MELYNNCKCQINKLVIIYVIFSLQYIVKYVCKFSLYNIFSLYFSFFDENTINSIERLEIECTNDDTIYYAHNDKEWDKSSLKKKKKQTKSLTAEILEQYVN